MSGERYEQDITLEYYPEAKEVKVQVQHAGGKLLEGDLDFLFIDSILLSVPEDRFPGLRHLFKVKVTWTPIGLAMENQM